MKFEEIYPILVIIQAASIVFHSVGIYLLSLIRPSSANNDISQRPFLYILSLIDILQSTLGIISDTCTQLGQADAAHYFEYANFGVYVTYVLFITALTINRLLEIYLNIRYQLYWSRTKSKCVVIACFILGAICGTLLIIMKICDIKLPTKFGFLSICLDSIALFVSVITNGYILCKVVVIKREQQAIKKRLRANRNSSHKSFDMNNNNGRHREKQNDNNNNKAYFLISALVLSTLLFLLAPDLLVNLMSFEYIPRVEKFYYISLIFYAVGQLSDALIYILLYPPVQKIVSAKLKCRGGDESRRDSWTMQESV